MPKTSTPIPHAVRTTVAAALEAWNDLDQRRIALNVAQQVIEREFADDPSAQAFASGPLELTLLEVEKRCHAAESAFKLANRRAKAAARKKPTA